MYYGDYKNTSYSYTDIDDKYVYEYDIEIFNQYQVPVYTFPFIFCTTGNIILLIIIICNKDMRTVPNMYILNLAISDILYLTVLLSKAFVKIISSTWLEGEFMCTFIPFSRRLSVCLSAYSVPVLSIQRYRVTITIQRPCLFSQHGEIRSAKICGVWIVAALFAIPSALSKYVGGGLTVLRRINYHQLVATFEILVSCVLPLFVIAISYITAAQHLVESSRSIPEGTQNPQLKTRRNAAKIVLGLTVVFVINYVPYHVRWTYINCTVEQDKAFDKITDILNHSNYNLL